MTMAHTKRRARLHIPFKDRSSYKPSLPEAFFYRQTGLTGFSLPFEYRHRSHFAKLFLPNSKKLIDKCLSKAFVSQYVKDGKGLVVASQDAQIKYFSVSNASKYKLLRSISARDVGWSILDVAVSPDGEDVVYSSWSDKLHQFKLSGGPETHLPFDVVPIDGGRFCCFSLKFSPDSTGSEILAGGSDCCIYVYDRSLNRRTLRIKAHEDDVNAVCFAGKTADIFYTGSDDGLIKTWDRRLLSEEDPKPVACFAGHVDGVTFVDSKGDARMLISNSKDQTIKLWDIRKPSTRSQVRAAVSAVAGQSWDYRWQNISNLKRGFQSESDSSVKTFANSHAVQHTLIRCFFSPVFTTGQTMIYTGCASGACVVYDVTTGETLKRLKGHKACVRDVSWHPYQNEICTSSWDSYVYRWTFRGSEDDKSDGEVLSSDESEMESTFSSDEEVGPIQLSSAVVHSLTSL